LSTNYLTFTIARNAATKQPKTTKQTLLKTPVIARNAATKQPKTTKQTLLKTPVIARSPALRDDEANLNNHLEKIFNTTLMKHISHILVFAILLASSCTSQKKLAYLNNLPETNGEETFTMDIPDYKIQPRDILYITVKAMTPDGTINDFLMSARNMSGNYISQGESGGYLYGYDVNPEGNIVLPVVGLIKVGGLTLEETRKLLQTSADKVFRNSTVECKLLSFKFTVIGEVRTPGTYINYNNYLTVLEAIGRAGGLSDYGRRDNILVVRPIDGGTKTFRLNLQDKQILSNEAYFLLPNDVVIIEPESKKIFNLNLPTFSFILTSVTAAITTTLLLINYFGK
jgi:polysaccharide biosynthesis/export protein